jgi:hypothetical protein
MLRGVLGGRGSDKGRRRSNIRLMIGMAAVMFSRVSGSLSRLISSGSGSSVSISVFSCMCFLPSGRLQDASRFLPDIRYRLSGPDVVTPRVRLRVGALDWVGACEQACVSGNRSPMEIRYMPGCPKNLI